MHEATRRELPPEVCERYVYYDIANDIVWREVSTAEVAIVQEARRACGLAPLVFVGPPADHAPLMQAAEALREVLGMRHGMYPFTAVLHEAVTRLHGVYHE
jgi:hypothetical protein